MINKKKYYVVRIRGFRKTKRSYAKKKLNKLREEYAKRSDPSNKFELEMQIEDLQKEIEELTTIIEAKKLTSTAQSLQIDDTKERYSFISDFIDKYYDIIKFMGQGKLEEAISTARLLSNVFDNDLYHLSFRLQEYSKEYDRGNLSPKDFINEKEKIATDLLKILESTRDLYNRLYVI